MYGRHDKCRQVAESGIDAVIGEELSLKTFFRKPVIANISGFSGRGICLLLRADRQGGTGFGTSPEAAAEVTRAVKAVTTKPVYIKLRS